MCLRRHQEPTTASGGGDNISNSNGTGYSRRNNNPGQGCGRQVAQPKFEGSNDDLKEILQACQKASRGMYSKSWSDVQKHERLDDLLVYSHNVQVHWKRVIKRKTNLFDYSVSRDPRSKRESCGFQVCNDRCIPRMSCIINPWILRSLEETRHKFHDCQYYQCSFRH